MYWGRESVSPEKDDELERLLENERTALVFLLFDFAPRNHQNEMKRKTRRTSERAR